MTSITCIPDPPCAGRIVKLCYDGATPATLSVTFTPPGTAKSYTIPAGQTCVTVNVPTGAITMIVEDLSGKAEDLARPVVECAPSEPAKERRKR